MSQEGSTLEGASSSSCLPHTAHKGTTHLPPDDSFVNSFPIMISSSTRKALQTLFQRTFSTVSKQHQTNLSKIPSRQRPRAIKQAQQALTEYLHSTRSLPFTYAEQISKHSAVSLSNLIHNVAYSPSDYFKSFQKFLRYHPVNEFEFFYESIGIDYDEVCGFLPKNKFFIYEDESAFNVACGLAAFGFPWNKLGMLYRENSSIFSRDAGELLSRLRMFGNEYGFGNITVIGICLAFPHVLTVELGGEVGALLDDLKRFFVDFDLGSCVDGNVDAWYDICRKVRLFYDLGCEKGKMGELMGKSKNIFVDCSIKLLTQKVQYFCRFSVPEEHVGLLLLQRPEILDFDLNTRVISVEGLLSHFGLSDESLKSIAQKYPHVLGRNKMANLPHVLRAMDLHEWFFNKIKDGSHQLLASYAISSADEGVDTEVIDTLYRIQGSRTPIHTMKKLDFMLAVGFGENALTMKLLKHLHGSGIELQERFDCLCHAGISVSKLCTMVTIAPKILNQKPEIIERKVNFLCNEMGSSLQYLDIFPAFLCFNLENRIKPRYKFHVWLTEKGLSSVSSYSISSLVATSERNFIARLYGIHPAVPKHWFECFAYQA